MPLQHSPLKMAANMQQYLEDVLQMNPQGKRQKFQEAGVTTLNALVRKSDEFAHKASQTIRKSTTGQALARDVTLEEESRLHRLVIFCRFRYVIQRPIAFGVATLENLEEVTTWYDQLEEDPADDTVAVFTDNCNKKEWFESIAAYLARKKGKSTGFPLLYVIREVADLPDVADDPGFGAYPSYNDELLARGRHAGHFYNSDNAAVWTFLRTKCHGTTAWTTIMSYGARRDGRGAFVALLGQFMGADAKALLLKKAERVLDTITFDGRNRNWTFNKFIGKLRESFLDLGPDNQLSEQRKVNKLMQAWQVQSLQHLRATVSATPAYKNNFDACVYFLSEQLTSLQLMNGGPGRNVSAVTKSENDTNNKQLRDLQVQIKSLQQKLKNKKGGKDPSKIPAKRDRSDKFDPSNPSAYVPKKVWMTLSDEDKVRVREARTKKGIPTRSVNSIFSRRNRRAQIGSNSRCDNEMDVVVEEMQAMQVDPSLLTSPPTKQTTSPQLKTPPLPVGLPKPPGICALKTSQRDATYSKKKPASNI